MREERRKVSENNVFTLTIDELEEGERPGWYKRVVVETEGDHVRVRLDVVYYIGKYRAKWEIMKIRVKSWIRRFL